MACPTTNGKNCTKSKSLRSMFTLSSVSLAADAYSTEFGISSECS
jgi:hypothetical protein